jgi:hypothetical protein
MVNVRNRVARPRRAEATWWLPALISLLQEMQCEEMLSACSAKLVSVQRLMYHQHKTRSCRNSRFLLIPLKNFRPW